VTAQEVLSIKDVEFDAATGTITDYTASYTDIVIPSSFNVDGSDIKVTAIGERAFYASSLTSVIIPNSVITIGKMAFFENSLTSITIPDSVTYIGERAFVDNSITNVIIPNSVTYIGKMAFNNNAITEINEKPSNGLIYARNNDGSDDTTTIISYGGIADTIDFIPNGVTTIGDNAFYRSTIMSVTIPNSVTYIGDEVFSKNSLKSVTIPNSVTYIGKYAFSTNSIKSLTIPNSVKYIGKYAFNSNSLASVIIPNSVTYIGEYAFTYNSLTSVTFEDGSYIRLILGGAFSNNPDLTAIALPSNANPKFSGYKDSDGNSYNSKDEITDFSKIYFADLPTHTLTINDVKFDTATGTISDYIEGYVDIIIPSSFNVNGSDISVTTLKEGAFSDNYLMNVIIPNSVTYIGGWAFVNNTLTTLTIPNSVTYIGDWAFANNSLTTLIIPNSVTYIGGGAFSNNSLTNVTIPNSVTYIGEYAFYDNSLTSISLPDPVIKEGYTFTEWHNSLGEVVYEITDFYSLYEAQFDFTGVMVSGVVTSSFNLDGVVLNITGDITNTQNINPDGTYRFALNKGRTVIITPVKEGYIFTPENISINNIQTDLSGQNFIMKEDTPTTIKNKQDVSNILVYPNPVKNVLNIKINDKYDIIQVINTSGVVLKTLNCKGMSEVRVDMQQLPKGIYFIKTENTEKNTVVQKVIKQ
jgi:hypothetical protein